MISQPPDQVSPFVHFEGQRAAMERYSAERLYVGVCEFGLGVFARRRIAPWETILVFDGPIIDFGETKRRAPRECMAVQIGPNRYLDTQPPAVFVNHSCEPNAGIRADKYLVALREIRKGEEIRFDYSTTMEEGSFTMNCRCGAAGCRRVVTDSSKLPREVRRQYVTQGVVMSFILDRGIV